jgi:hypothetical protein
LTTPHSLVWTSATRDDAGLLRDGALNYVRRVTGQETNDIRNIALCQHATFLALTFCGVAAAETKPTVPGNDPGRIFMAQADGKLDGPLGVDSRLREIMQHPAFRGFGRLLLPWDGRTYDENMRLSEIGSLLPYHTHVSPGVVVGALNRMIDDARNGRTIFYDIYAERQKSDEPAKAYTGLFFYRGRPGAPFAIIAPGGGFSYVGSVHEGFP